MHSWKAVGLAAGLSLLAYAGASAALLWRTRPWLTLE